MTYKGLEKLLFLSWESPWPAHSGGALRTLGLLKELSKTFKVELILLTRKPLSTEQIAFLDSMVCKINRLPLRDVSFCDKLLVAMLMFKLQIPYHCAILELSFRKYPHILKRIRNFEGVVYASYGHWGYLVRNDFAANWILDQHNADVEFWRVYASQVSNHLVRLAALVNYRLCENVFPQIYRAVGRIISVCEKDRQLTLALAPEAQVEVIENGVDCSYYVPNTQKRSGQFRLLFTGTSASRNMIALHQFVYNVFPLIQKELPETKLLVGGDFHVKAQAKFNKYSNIRFTGRVEDIRPIFNASDVYVAPFEETHGSKLKIAEAMAMGMAIVSTPEGIRGFPLVDGKSVLVAHNNEQFASHTVSLLNDPVKRKRIGVEARKIAETFIDWQVLGNRLVRIINLVYEKILK